MTDFDKTLINKAHQISRYNYRDIDVLISIADTVEAKEILYNIRFDKQTLTLETL